MIVRSVERVVDMYVKCTCLESVWIHRSRYNTPVAELTGVFQKDIFEVQSNMCLHSFRERGWAINLEPESSLFVWTLRRVRLNRVIMNNRNNILEPFTEIRIITLRPVIDKIRRDIFALPLAVIIHAAGRVRIAGANRNIILYYPLFIIGEIDLSVVWEFA
jgi:hypothetical protein